MTTLTRILRTILTLAQWDARIGRNPLKPCCTPFAGVEMT